MDWQWIAASFLSSRVLVAVVLACLLIPTGLRMMLGLPVSEFTADASFTGIFDSGDEGETISQNMDTLLLLQEEEWEKLDMPAKLRVLKTVADIEAHHLGVDTMTVCAEPLGENTLGQYNNITNTITLNISYLSISSPQIMLATLCHECFHAYQHRLIALYDQVDREARELLLFRDAAIYKDEFANYIDGAKNYEGYSAQWCEIDSDQYAEEAVIDYYYHIDQYNKEKEKSE